MKVAILAAAILAAAAGSPAFADTRQVTMHREFFGARIDTAVYPPAGRKPYKKGQRLVYTIWVDNDDPDSGLVDVVIRLPKIPDGQRLDLSAGQSPYGNIFTDSRLAPLTDPPGSCRLYYVSNPEGDRRHLTPGTDVAVIRNVMWVCSQPDGKEIIAKHDKNDPQYRASEPDVRFGAPVDFDEMYVRYAVIVDVPPATPAKPSKKSKK